MGAGGAECISAGVSLSMFRRSLARWRRIAKSRNDLNIASWSSRFGSLCGLVSADVLIGTAAEQQKMGAVDGTLSVSMVECGMLAKSAITALR